MTRRHYVLLSEALRGCHPAQRGMRVTPLFNVDTARQHTAELQHRLCCQAVADALGDDNARFDKERFMRDTGHHVGEEVIL